jgi:hypothetical protein
MQPGTNVPCPGLQIEALVSRAQGACAGTLPPDDPPHVTEEADMRFTNRYAQSLAASVVVLATLAAAILANAGASMQVYL